MPSSNYLRGTGTRQPVPGVQPDYTHPLCPPWEGGAVIVGNTILGATDPFRKILRYFLGTSSNTPPTLNVETNVSLVAGKRGNRALAWPATLSQGINVSGQSAWLPTTAVTILLGYRKTDTTARASSPFWVNAGGGGTASRMGAHLPYNDNTIYFDFGGATAGTTRLSAAWTPDALPHVWAFTTGARGMEIWKDGTLYASNGATPTRVNGGVFFVGGGETASTDAAELEFFYLWPSQVPTGVIQQVTAQPYLFWQQSGPRLSITGKFRSGGGAGGGGGGNPHGGGGGGGGGGGSGRNQIQPGGAISYLILGGV